MLRSSAAFAHEDNKRPGTKWARRDVTLILTVAATCVLLAFALLPSHSATLPTAESIGGTTAQKNDRLTPYPVLSACSNESWGSENLVCLRAISMAGGRTDSLPTRIVVAAGPSERPNDFH